MEKNNRLAIIYALIAVAMWSTVATAFKLSLQHLSSLQLLTGASCFSLVILSFALLQRKEFKLAFLTFPDNYKKTVFMALLNPIFYYVILLRAYDLLPAQIAQSLNYTWAITLTLLSVPILKHHITSRDFIAIIMGYVGVVFIIMSAQELTSSLSVEGVILALLSTFIWAGYWIINTHDVRPPLIKLFQSFLVASPLLLILTFFTDGLTVFQSLTVWPYVFYIGAFEMGLAFIFWQMAMQATNRVSQISTLIFLSPIASLLIIRYVLGEPIYWLTLVGLALIISGILYQQFGARAFKLISERLSWHQ